MEYCDGQKLKEYGKAKVDPEDRGLESFEPEFDSKTGEDFRFSIGALKKIEDWMMLWGQLPQEGKISPRAPRTRVIR